MTSWITRLLQCRKGAGVIDLIEFLAVVSIGLGVISMVTGGFYNNIDRSQMDTEANDSMDKVITATWGGISMATVIPYVSVGLAIIGMVIALFADLGR